MAKAKSKKRKSKKKKTNWYDLGNEVMDAGYNVTKAIGREVTFHPDSINQRAMNGVASAMTAAVGAGAIAGHYAGAIAGPVVRAPVTAANAAIDAAHDRLWNRDPNEITGSKDDKHRA